MWLYINKHTELRCRSCDTLVQTRSAEVYICAQSVRTGRHVVRCRCGDPFTYNDFVDSGAQIVDRPILRRPNRSRRPEIRQAA